MQKKSHVHFVGINGIGMSGIAKILYEQGHIISGCDLAHDLNNIQKLIDNGCNISNQHNSTMCHDASITTVVYSSDVSYNSPELIHARNRGIKTIQRASMLAQIMNSTYAIGIAGSHGKTTTTAMIGHILTEANIDPTIIVGGIMNNITSNSRYGKSKYVVAETDESDRSLLLLPITLAVLTNIDFEHANTYRNINEVIDVFATYLEQLPTNGKAIVCLDDENIAQLLPNLTVQTTTYGTTKTATIQAVNTVLHADYSTFDIIHNPSNSILGNFTINLPSIYNVLNATAAIATSLELAIPLHDIQQALESFKGVDRRFTYKGTTQDKNLDVFDDYGHHPTEIHHSLITAKRKSKNNLIVVFQPQRYTRTFHLWNEFVQTFQTSNIDHLIITDIYAASESAIANITSERLAQEIQLVAPNMRVHFIPFQPDLKNIHHMIESIADKNDLILLLGAGKVNKLAEILLP